MSILTAVGRYGDSDLAEWRAVHRFCATTTCRALWSQFYICAALSPYH
jgi:hypothetical protein